MGCTYVSIIGESSSCAPFIVLDFYCGVLFGTGMGVFTAGRRHRNLRDSTVQEYCVVLVSYF